MSTKSAAAEELCGFVDSAKQHGIGDDVIVALLRRNGWSERLVYGALNTYYAGVLGAAPPARSGPSEHARDAFYYLLNFMTLGFWTVALGQIFYTLIAHYVPDAAQSSLYEGSLRDQIAWQVATVIVAFPIFAFIHRLIQSELRRRPDLYDSGVRKWLTYVALVIAAMVVLGDAIWFLEGLLRGDMTLRFVLDSLVLFVLGGGVFAYYLATIEPPKAQQ